MSLRGQWIAPYAGTNTGMLVLDIDEVGDHYEGTACAWDASGNNPSAMVRISTSNKDTTQRLNGVQVHAMLPDGTFLSNDDVDKIVAERGAIYPRTVDIDVSLSGGNLSISWRTSVGSSGGATATAPMTRAGLPSDLKPLAIRTWNQFKDYVNAADKRRYIFRGQADKKWRLRTSFHRTGRADIEKYVTADFNDLRKNLSPLMSYAFDSNDKNHYASFINLVQHHGYPTPLLDWTWSPYVAAFFAFRNVAKNTKKGPGKKVRIFKFDAREWNKLPRASKLFPVVPNVSILDALAYENPRAIPQQSILTISNVDDIEAYINSVEQARNREYLEVIELPYSERLRVMEELALMGITAGSLFPGFDGACESLKERNF